MKVRSSLLIALLFLLGNSSTVSNNPYPSFKTTFITLTALYGCCYGYTQLVSRNRPVFVNLIEDPTHHLTHGKEQYLFVHGIADTHEQAYWYTKRKSSLSPLIDGRVFSYDYPDVTNHFWRVNITQTSLGQKNEIEGLKDAYEQALDKIDDSNSPNKKIVLIGLSRGASTILNFMGLHHPKRVKAIIAESPFDSTHTIIKNILRMIKLDTIFGMQEIGNCVLSALFWQHSINGAQPINTVPLIDKEIPLLLVCSQQDRLIPAESTIALYKKLRKEGHKKVHLFVADQGRHSRILKGPDGIRYRQIVHAFYKQYELPHDPDLATAGTPLLAQSQPEM